MARVSLVRSVNGMWKYFKMRQQAKGFFKGMMTGLAVGAVVIAIGNRMMKGDHGTHRNCERSKKDLGELLKNLQELFH